MKKSPTRRLSLLVPMLTAALIVVGWGVASAGPCIPDGQTCRTDQSCCGGVCVKEAKKSFGTCCSPTTCAAAGANCGTIADGCGGTLDCGTCTLPETCGGGGTPNVCGTAIQCCMQSSPMGAFDTCMVETPVQCHAQGGIAQGSGTCSPNPCPTTTIDMTGRWVIQFLPGGPVVFDFMQVGTALTMTPALTQPGAATGTIDSTTGAFVIEDPLPCQPLIRGGFPSSQCAIVGTVTLDGATFTGTELCIVAGAVACGGPFPSAAVVGTRG